MDEEKLEIYLRQQEGKLKSLQEHVNSLHDIVFYADMVHESMTTLRWEQRLKEAENKIDGLTKLIATYYPELKKVIDSQHAKKSRYVSLH